MQNCPNKHNLDVVKKRMLNNFYASYAASKCSIFALVARYVTLRNAVFVREINQFKTRSILGNHICIQSRRLKTSDLAKYGKTITRRERTQLMNIQKR